MEELNDLTRTSRVRDLAHNLGLCYLFQMEENEPPVDLLSDETLNSHSSKMAIGITSE